MDDLVTFFVDSTYTEAAKEDIFQALGLFRTFNHLEPFNEINNLLMQQSFVDSTTLADGLVQYILRGQAYILDHHGVTLSDETTLAFNNTVLRGLYQLQHLEDPTPVLRILESMDNDEFKFCRILALHSSIPETTFLQIVEEVRPVCLTMLGEFLYAQEDNQGAVTPIPKRIVDMVQRFKETYGINAAVRIILDADVVMAESFSVYRPIFDELREVVTEERTILETLLFLLIYSSDGVDDPIGVFSQYVDGLVPDMATGQRLTRTLAEMYNKLNQVKAK